MKKIALVFLVGLSLFVTIAFSPNAESAQLAAHPPKSPISPLPSSGDHSSDADLTIISGDSVWLLQGGSSHFWIKTRQVGVGWWDAAGELHIVLSVNGIVKIPLTSAVMISIPGDVMNVSAPSGWQKFKRPENGEWVIVRVE